MTVITALEPALTLIRAPNPSPMTAAGTNTYIVGDKSLCIIDPGPDDLVHFERICATVQPGSTVSAVLVTHAHRDHSALAQRIAQHFSVPIQAFGDAKSGRSSVMQSLVTAGLTGGGEGVDLAFRPDLCLADNAMIDLGAESIQAIWTPGHMGNHMCFLWRDAVFSGDHVMGWASSIVSPPDGDMKAFIQSLDKVARLKARRLFPGHGACVESPERRIADLRQHRLDREQHILKALSTKPCSIAELVDKIYAEIPSTLKPAAARNVHAHLIALWQDRQVATDALPVQSATYRIARHH